MTNLSRAFKEGRVLIPYFTYGDISPDFTENLMIHAFEKGANMIEIGLPFSDPIADGPVIQASHFRALKNNKNLTISNALKMVKRVKSRFSRQISFRTAWSKCLVVQLL